jgi:hypothetical protein
MDPELRLIYGWKALQEFFTLLHREAVLPVQEETQVAAGLSFGQMAMRASLFQASTTCHPS